MGLAVAYTLGREKLRVTLVERGAVGREASWAAAGYLTFQGSSNRPGPRLDLTRASFQMYEAWLGELAEYTPADTGFCALRLDRGVPGARRKRKRRRCARRGSARPGTGSSGSTRRPARKRHPHLAPKLPVHGGLLFPEVAQVRPPRLLKALTAAVILQGVRVLVGGPGHGDRPRR